MRPLASIFTSPFPFEIACVCHPSAPITVSPGENAGFLEDTISPTVPPTITAPMFTLAAYDFASFMRPRMYGSRDR
jgi:hypothetical protein